MEFSIGELVYILPKKKSGFITHYFPHYFKGTDCYTVNFKYQNMMVDRLFKETELAKLLESICYEQQNQN